jgi:hypothetical protein
MNNQHAGLSQVLAEQRMTERRQQAAQARLSRSARPPGRRHRSRSAVAGGSWPGGQPSPPSSQPAARTAPVDRSEATMSKLARTLILGATLAAMNLVGLTAVASAKPTTTQTVKTPDGHLANAKSGSPGASARSHHSSRPPPTPPSSGSWPTNASPSPAGHPPRCPTRRELTNRTDSPAGPSPRSVGWLRPWCSSLDRSCWPPDAPAAEPGSGTQPDHRLGHALDGAALPTGSPITLAGDGLVAWLAGGRGMASVCAAPGGLLERIPSSLTLAGDLGKRRSAQR